MGGLFFIAGGVAMSLRILRSSGDLYHYFRQLRCLKRAMISFHYLPASTGTDIAPTPEQLEHRVQATLREYDRESGDYIPMLGVVAPPSRDADDYVPIPGVGDLPRDDTDYWHIHLVLQRHNRSEEKPVKDPALLTRLGRKHWLVVKVSNHPKLQNSDDETDLLEYVSDHAEQEGTQVLAGPGVRTNFTKDRSLTGAERRTAGSSGRLMNNSRRATPTPQELAKKQRAAEQRTCPVYRPRRTPAPKPVPVQTAQQSAPRRRELAAGKRRLLPNGQVVMTLPRNDSARTSRTT
jgi:hypothetical protein